MNVQLKNLFILSACAILVLTASAKLYSAFGPAGILRHHDPLLFVQNRHVLMGIGLLEVIIAAVMVLSRNDLMKYLALAWLSANFIFYRLAIWLLHLPGPCPCLGRITDHLPFKASTIDWVLKGIISYLLLFSVVFYLRGERRKHQRLMLNL